MMRVIIIDDEKLARENIKILLKQNFPMLQIVGEASSVETGIEVLTSTETDLVFLDINLFDGSGFNILEELDEINFQVIFITAYSDFAIKAFRVNALDYILKPINLIEFTQAIAKAIMYHSQIQFDLNKGKKVPINKRIAIKDNNGIRFVDIPLIIRCKSDNNYTEVFLNTGERIISSRTLKEFTGILEKFDFFRIHQSHLINLKHIKRIIKQDGGVSVELDNGAVLDVSRRKKESLMNRIAIA